MKASHRKHLISQGAFLFMEIIMANEQNLKPIRKGDLSKEELKKRQSNGGLKSAEARREKRLIKDRILERMGESDWDAMIDGLIARATESDKAFELLRDTIGQKPSDKIDLSIEDESAREIDEYFAERYNIPTGK